MPEKEKLILINWFKIIVKKNMRNYTKIIIIINYHSVWMILLKIKIWRFILDKPKIS